MNIKNILILLLLSGILLSCNKDNETEDLENMQNVEYTFVKMEFITSGPSDMSEVIEIDPTVTWANGLSSILTVTFDSFQKIYDTSQFSGIDSSVINHIVNSPIIAVPIDISNDNKVTLGEAKWPISNTTERQKIKDVFENHVQVGPHSKTVFDMKIHYTKIATNFKLTLQDVRDNKEHVFEGKWVGLTKKSTESKLVSTEL